MAQIVDSSEVPCRHENRRYPWDEWLDGKTRRLVLGEDYSNAESIRAAVRAAAMVRGMKAIVQRRDGGNVVFLTARPIEKP